MSFEEKVVYVCSFFYVTMGTGFFQLLYIQLLYNQNKELVQYIRFNSKIKVKCCIMLEDNISFKNFAWHVKLSLCNFYLPFIHFLLSLSYFQNYFPLSVLHSWNLFNLPQIFLGLPYRNTWPPISAALSRFSCTYFSWRPACHRKKKENVMPFHRGCHIANGIEQCNNNEMCVTHEMKWNATRAEGKKIAQKRELKIRRAKSEKKRKQNSRPGKKNFKHGANIMSCVLACLASLSLRISLRLLLLGKSNIDLWRVRMSGRQKKKKV